MRNVFFVLALVFCSMHGVAEAQDPVGLGERLARLATVEESGDATGAAQLAQEIAALDFSATPLQQSEVRELRASLVDTLAAGGRLSEAIALLEQIIIEDRAALASATDPVTVTTSELRLTLAARLERLGDLQTQAGLAPAAAASYALALEQSRTALGRTEPQTRFVLGKLIEAQRAAGLAPAQEEVALLRQLEVASETERLSPLGGAQTTQTREFETIRVFFGASRNATGSQDPERTFGERRSGLSLGSVLVTVPRNRAVGSIPRPGIFDFNGAQDGVHIVLKRVDRDASESDFRGRLSRSVSASERGQRDVFVYVHGFQEPFNNAVRRTAQLAVDLDMRNGAILYAWPSGENLASYQVGQNNVEPSAVELARLLRIATNAGAERVHLLAHSMGNRVLLAALGRLRQSGFAVDRPAFGQIIFASPDVDAEVFVDQLRGVRGVARGMTLYASADDRALQLSRFLGGNYVRAGQVPIMGAIAQSLVAVDTSPVRASVGEIIGHSDYAGGAINDLRAVVWLSLAPESRCLLVLRNNYWEASDARLGCEDTSFRRAISAIRLHGASAQAQIQTLIGQLEAGHNGAEAASWRSALAIVQRIQR